MTASRIALSLIALIAIVATLAYRQSVFREPPPPPRPSILFLTGGSSPYWQITASGAQAAAKDLDVDLTVEMPEGDENLEQQMALLMRLDTEKTDGLAVSPLDAEGQTHLINRLARRVNVVTFDSDAPLSERQGYVGASNYAAGQLCAKLVEQAVPEGGKVAVLLANLTKNNLVDRKTGFAERMATPGGIAPSDAESDSETQNRSSRYEIVGYLVDEGDSQRTARLIRETIAEHPDLACLVGMNAQHGPILMEVLREDDLLGKIQLVTFDEEVETLAGIESGHIYATVAQDPYKYGYEAIGMLDSLCRGDKQYLPIVGRGSMFVDVEAINKENLEEFRERLRGREESSTGSPAPQTAS